MFNINIHILLRVETTTNQSLEMVNDIAMSSVDTTELQQSLFKSYEEAFGRVEKLHTLTLGVADVLIDVTGNVAELKAATHEAHRLQQSTALSIERSLNDLQDVTLAVHGLQQSTALSIERSLNDLQEIREIAQTFLLPTFRRVKHMVSKPFTMLALVGRLLIGFLISRAPFLRKYTLPIMATSIISAIFKFEGNPWGGGAAILQVVLMWIMIYGRLPLLVVSLVCLRKIMIRFSQHFKWDASYNKGGVKVAKTLGQQYSSPKRPACEGSDGLDRLSRKELQQVAKAYGVPANLKTRTIIQSLRAQNQYHEVK